MKQRGVEMSVISAWLGHTKPSFTADTYARDAQPSVTFGAAGAALRTALTQAPRAV